MATYREIQSDIQNQHDRTVRTCWIADVKSAYGLTTCVAHNRESLNARKHPCPPSVRPLIEDSMRRFGMIK